MPRKSAAALSTVACITEARPEPPQSLTPAQAEEWRAIAAALPVGWFRRETHGLLAVYVQHATAAKTLGGLIDSFDPKWLVDPDGLDRYTKLLTARERETRAMASLATRLRITNQSRYQPNAAARATASAKAGPAPWEAKVG